MIKTIPYSFALVILIIWRIFFFKSTRYTTDISRIGYDQVAKEEFEKDIWRIVDATGGGKLKILDNVACLDLF
ncbi:MAG: hypothetical protein Q7U53_18600 [Anaerolineaceae bacterium]|nr:hypothetical protein [Anaerolineaceae bacterium]